ncbi:50S ribosomal protein L10 [Patescibacteria group bacterium]
MAKTRQQKEEEIDSIVNKIERVKTMVISSINDIGVNESLTLRRQMRAEKVDLMVVKKRLLKLALEKAKIEDVPLDDYTGTIAVAFGYNDEVAPARLLHEFSKANEEKVELFGGVMNGKFINTDKVNELALLPSASDMLIKTIWTIKAPISGLANVLSGTMRNLLYALKAIHNKTN